MATVTDEQKCPCLPGTASKLSSPAVEHAWFCSLAWDLPTGSSIALGMPPSTCVLPVLCGEAALPSAASYSWVFGSVTLNAWEKQLTCSLSPFKDTSKSLLCGSYPINVLSCYSSEYLL